jgi:hypothetical protein
MRLGIHLGENHLCSGSSASSTTEFGEQLREAPAEDGFRLAQQVSARDIQ